MAATERNSSKAVPFLSSEYLALRLRYRDFPGKMAGEN